MMISDPLPPVDREVPSARLDAEVHGHCGDPLRRLIRTQREGGFRVRQVATRSDHRDEALR